LLTVSTSAHGTATSWAAPIRTRIPAVPTMCGLIFRLANRPIIQSRPQMLSASMIQRAGSQGTTLRMIRSRIGISTTERPMKTPRMGVTTPR
jgi:hypothetical protein